MSNIHIHNLSAYTTPTIQESKRDEWVEFGEDNNYFQFLIDRYTNSTTNNAIINNISRLVYGQGLTALDASRKPSEYAQMKTLFSNDDMRKMVFDRKLFGQFAIQVHYNEKHDAILKAFHIPVNLLRAEKCNEEGEITGYYYSDDWSNTKKFTPQRFNAFGYSKEKIEILYVKPYGVGMKYYSHPDYQGALPYTLLEQEVSDYLINEVQNGFSGTKIVNFNNGVPSEEQQEIISRKVLNKLTGSRGQKVIVAFNNNAESKTDVTDIPLNDAPAHYEYLSQECLSKIMLGHNVTSPLIFGIATTTGFSSNADELRNSIVLFENMVIKPFQSEIIEAFNKILSFNNISLNLEFKGLNPLDSTGDITNTSDNVKLLDSINNVSPLVANKILESMTANEIRQIVGLAPEQGGSDLPSIPTAQALANQKKIESLINLGEDPQEDWILIDEFEVDYDQEDEIDAEIEQANNPKQSLLSKVYNFVVSTGTARPRANSEQDTKIEGVKYITRYRYEGGISDKTRDFCKEMIKANKIYRKEDIDFMKDVDVNPGWGPKGTDFYDIFLYKGGGACHHKWMRQTFVAFDKNSGIDPLSPNAKTISTNKAEKAGYRIRNPQQVSMRPIDMPNQGFLPTNKRFN